MGGNGNATTKTTGTPWRSRIVGHGEEDPTQLLGHELNWRVHPRTQQVALSGVLDEVGWVAEVIVNRRSGAEWPEGKRGVGTVVDGHLRVELAISRGEKTVPMRYLELSEAEEALILATLDPISALAGSDRENLDAVLGLVETENEAVRELLAAVHGDESAMDAGSASGEEEEVLRPYKMVHVLFSIPVDRYKDVAELLDRLRMIPGIEWDQSAN